ncbi:MAG: hypothetical protein LBB83_09135, partial [Treponema sp.]|nr:hypothetical protein [Treponema sp.]
MKKLFGVLAVLACASSPATGDSGSSGKGRLSGVPSFVISPPRAEDVIYGVGAAQMATDSMGMAIAENRACVSIVKQIDSWVRNMIDDLSETTGAGAEDSLSFAQTVSRTLDLTRLSGTRCIETGKGDDGTIYVLVAMGKAEASRQVSDIINKEKIKYAAFENWNARR